MKNTGGKEIVMSLQDELDAQRAGLECKVPAEDLAEHEQRQAQRNPLQRIPGVAITVKMNLGRRRFLIGSAVAGIGGVAPFLGKRERRMRRPAPQAPDMSFSHRRKRPSSKQRSGG
ncbi:MAG: hypothetical protein ABSG18_22730 [Steroidobacteraceae bacterium]